MMIWIQFLLLPVVRGYGTRVIIFIEGSLLQGYSVHSQCIHTSTLSLKVT